MRRESMKNRLVAIMIVCFLTATGFLGYITIEPDVVNASTTIYVGTGPGNNSATISGGIVLASSGDTVYVYNGTYGENLNIYKSINIIGENKQNTIIDGGGNSNVVEITVDWVNMTGFTVRKCGDSITAINNAGIKLIGAQNCRIFNNNVWMNADDGIQLYSNSNQNIIEDNYITGNDNGINLEGAKYNELINNVLISNEFGIRFKGASYNNISENNISYSVNAIAAWGGNGNNLIGNDISESNLWFHSQFENNFINNNVTSTNMWQFQLYDSSQFNIIGNNFSAVTGAFGGIILIRSFGDNFINNQFLNAGIYITGDQLFHFNTHVIPDNNTVNGKPLYYYKNSNGVRIEGIPVGQLILANCSDYIVKNLHINNTYVGIHGDYFQNISIKNNNLSDNYIGIALALSTLNNTIYHNKFNNNLYQAYDSSNNSNQWDNSYPSGGNYWSDFDEPSEAAYDDYQGQDQYVLGGDGIVDQGLGAGGGKNIYTIVPGSWDNYPLIEPFQATSSLLLPPILFINVSSDGKDMVLNWKPQTIVDFDPYLIYRSTDPTNFDFSNPWVNTLTDKEPGEASPIPDRTMWNDTNAADPQNVTNYNEQYYYVMRAFDGNGDYSSTSRTVGKWTKTFQMGISTFSIPLRPLEPLDTDYYTSSMNATYIKYMDSSNHTWKKHENGDLNKNNMIMRLGEGYEVQFANQTNFTFTGMPGAMISYDNDTGFLGFDPSTEPKNLSASVAPNGNVTLNWQEPASMISGDWYEVYYSHIRDGFFGTLGNDYYLACSPLGFGNDTTTITNLGANNPGTQIYFMVVPFNNLGVRGASTYSIGIWTEEYLAQYDTFGIPLKLESSHNVDWYCDNIPDTVGMNYFVNNQQRWSWHSTRIPSGAFDPTLVMGEGYQISTSNATKFVFIGR